MWSCFLNKPDFQLGQCVSPGFLHLDGWGKNSICLFLTILFHYRPLGEDISNSKSLERVFTARTDFWYRINETN